MLPRHRIQPVTMVKDTQDPESSYILSSRLARRATLSWRITPKLRRLWWCFLPKAPITRLNAPSSLIFMRAIRPLVASDQALHGLPHPTTRVHAKFTRQHVRLCSPLYCAPRHGTTFLTTLRFFQFWDQTVTCTRCSFAPDAFRLEYFM